MKNLAGDTDADFEVREELYLADIESEYCDSDVGEVPYTIIGKLGHWRFRRAWRYWVATVENDVNGLPLKAALELHNMPNPVNPDQTLGQVIRSGGHAGAPSPDEYGAQPVYGTELDSKLLELGYEMKDIKIGNEIKSYIPITVGEISELCNEGKLDVERYVKCYHIDTQIGLHEFAKFLKKFYFSRK